MALVLGDRVKETTTTSGTGTYTLAGSITGFQSFGDAVGDGNTTYYACTDGSSFEIGIGTYTASGSTLARTTILKSTNSNSAVDWGSTTKDIFVTYPADKAVFKDASGNLAGLGTAAILDTGISNTNIPKFTSGVADDDFLRVDGTTVEGRSASEVLGDIGGQASLTFGISNTNAVKIDSASVADDEYARFTASGLESRSTSEVLSDIGGQASLTFGISNTNSVKIDSASVADDEYARFTSNGLESRSTSEVLSDIGGQASLTFGISNTNIPIFTSGVVDDDFLRVDGTSIEGRSASQVLSDIGGQAALTFGISDTNIPVFTSGVVDDDFLRVDGTSIEGRSASEVLSDIGGQASLTFGISNTNAVKIDSGSVADDEYARFTANGLESRSTSEVLSDIGGQASLTFGISNTNAVKIDSGSVADDEYARFTADGLESRSTSEVLSDIGGQASLTFGISNTNAVKIDSASVADDEYARFTADGLESRSTSEVLSDIGGQASLTFGISNTNIPIFTTGVVDDDFLKVAGTSIEGRSASEVLSDIGGQASLTFGISNTNAVKIDSASVADDEYARFTANGLESRSTSEVLSDIGGQAALTFGKSDTNALKLEEAVTTNDILLAGSSNVKGRTYTELKSDLSLNNVENTAISTFAGSSNITTIGTLAQNLIITSTDAGAGDAPDLVLYRNSSSPDDADDIGQIFFRSRNDNSQDVEYARIGAEHLDVSDGTEDGKLVFQVMQGGSLSGRMDFRGGQRTRFFSQDIELSQNVNLIFEGATANDFETTLTVTDPTADRTITLPDVDGIVATSGSFIGGVLLNKTTISDDANVEFGSSLITDDYDYYDIYVHNIIPATDATQLRARLGVGGSLDTGNNYTTTARVFGTKSSDTFETTNSTNATTNRINLTVSATQDMGTGTGESWSARYRFYNLRSTTFFKGMQGMEAGGVTAEGYFTVIRQTQFAALYNANQTNKVDTIQIFSSSGNLASGSISLYGFKI